MVSRTQIVVVVDAERPHITAPPTVTTTSDPGQNYASSVALGSPVVSDNCGVASVTNDAAQHFPLGTNWVTWTVADVHGNVNSATQQVIVSLIAMHPTGIVRNPDGTFSISFQGASNQVYVVEISSDLFDWFPVATNTAAENGTSSYTDAPTDDDPVRFYRTLTQ
jgi:hypothetical protein